MTSLQRLYRFCMNNLEKNGRVDPREVCGSHFFNSTFFLLTRKNPLLGERKLEKKKEKGKERNIDELGKSVL